jgi:hypothetical protein
VSYIIGIEKDCEIPKGQELVFVEDIEHGFVRFEYPQNLEQPESWEYIEAKGPNAKNCMTQPNT